MHLCKTEGISIVKFELAKISVNEYSSINDVRPFCETFLEATIALLCSFVVVFLLLLLCYFVVVFLLLLLLCYFDVMFFYCCVLVVVFF